MNASEAMHTRDLAQRLSEAEATIKALLSGEIDAVVDSRTSTPLLLSKAQDALRESVERYRILFENSPLPKWLYDLETLRFLAVNDAAVGHYGYSREEFLQMSIMDLCPPENVQEVFREIDRIELGPPSSFKVWKHQKKDGTVIDVEVTGHTFALEGRKNRLIVGQDITERRRAERALSASEEQMRLLLDSTGEGIYGIDLHGNCTLANAACLRMLGYREERELLGRNLHELAHHGGEGGTAGPVEGRIYQSGLRDEGSALDDEILWRSDGSHFPAQLRSFPLKRDGARVGAVVSFLDITARKKAEETMRWLAAIVEASWDAIIGTDPAGTITSWNQGAERIYGYAAGDALGKPISILSPEGQADVAGSINARALAGDVVRDFESIGVRKDGSRVDVSVTLSLIRDAAGRIRGVSGVSRDITDRRAAEEQVRLLNNIALAAGEATTLEETLNVVLRLICQATGIPLADAWVPGSGDKLECRGHWSRPEDRERFRPLIEGWSFEKGRGLPGRVWASRKLAWIANLAADANFARAALAEKLGLGAGVAVPILVGEQLELVAVIEAFLPQPGEANTNLIALLSAVAAQIGSVVQRRRAEEALRKSEGQLRQAQKMEAIGHLTGGVAHDFNNLLSVILGYSGLLVAEFEPGDPKRADLLEIKTAGERAAALTQQLLAFSRQQVLQPRVVDLNLVVGALEKMLRRLIGEDVDLTVIPAPAPAKAHIDPSQMEQVIMNLAVNARDAMPTGGKLTIEVGRVDLDEAYASAHAGASAGPHIMLAVSDTGSGMDAATQARVFEPFFTTKEPGKGTGLGLSTVFGIVRQSAGTIWLYSEPGKGTSFKIYLPVAGPGSEKTLSQPIMEPARLHGSETVLLLEDEEGVRKLVRSILQRNGYRVIEAKDGTDALRIAQNPGVIDLLLTDVVMPHMGGAEAASRLLAVRPGLKLLYMSGYTDNAVVLHGVLRSEAAFVQKPITPTALLSKVREVLDSP